MTGFPAVLKLMNSVCAGTPTFLGQPTQDGLTFQGTDEVATPQAPATTLVGHYVLRGLHLRSPQNIHSNAKVHQRSLRAWNFPLQLVRDIDILIYLVITRTSSGRVLLKIKLSKCVQSSHSIPQSHPVISFDADFSQGTSVIPPTVAAASAPDGTVTGLVQGHVSLNMPTVNLCKCSCSSCSRTWHLRAKATVGK